MLVAALWAGWQLGNETLDPGLPGGVVLPSGMAVDIEDGDDLEGLFCPVAPIFDDGEGIDLRGAESIDPNPEFQQVAFSEAVPECSLRGRRATELCRAPVQHIDGEL